MSYNAGYTKTIIYLQNNILYGVKKLLVGDNFFREALKSEKAVTVYKNLLNQIVSSSLVLKMTIFITSSDFINNRKCFLLDECYPLFNLHTHTSSQSSLHDLF